MFKKNVIKSRIEGEVKGMEKMAKMIISAIDNKLYNTGVFNPMCLPVMKDVNKAIKELISSKLKK